MTLQGLILAGVAAAMRATPVAAQDDPEIGSRLNKRVGPVNVREGAYAAQAGRRFFACLVHKRPSLAEAYMRAATPDDVGRVEKPLFKTVSCANIPGIADLADGQRINTSTDLQRGMIAEALIAQRMRDRAVPAALPLVRVYVADRTAVSERPVAIDEMAVCMASTNPAAIRDVIGTVPETGEEAAAFGRVIPQLGPCLQDNARLRANRQSLRAALAEALYHRMDAPVAGLGTQ